MVNEGSSAAREMYARLEPAHRDPEFLQLKAVPTLARLSRVELERLRGSLLPSDEPSFHEYASNLFVDW